MSTYSGYYGRGPDYVPPWRMPRHGFEYDNEIIVTKRANKTYGKKGKIRQLADNKALISFGRNYKWVSTWMSYSSFSKVHKNNYFEF